MHVGFITSEYPHELFKKGIGGIGTFTKNLAFQLHKGNYKVTVFVHSHSEDKVFEDNGIKVHFIKRKKLKGLTWWVNRKHIQQYISSVVKKDNISILEAPEWTGITAFMKFSVPLVLRLHGSDTFFCHLDKRKIKFKNKLFEKKALEGATKIVGVSNFVANKTKELFKLKTLVETVYNTIDPNQFTPDHSKIESKTLLYFGALIRKKGVLELASIFNKVIEEDKEVTITLLGRDTIDVFTQVSTLEMFKKQLTEEALKRFIYIPSVPYEEVDSYIKKANIVLLPSFAEAFPMTWLEAMVLEKQLVTSNIGWANELMINGETGYCVNPIDHQLYADKILELLSNQTRAAQMGERARNLIKDKFNSETSFQKNVLLYKKVIAEC